MFDFIFRHSVNVMILLQYSRSPQYNVRAHSARSRIHYVRNEWYRLVSIIYMKQFECHLLPMFVCVSKLSHCRV